MLKNYFTIAWRNLRRNRTFSILNILGLAVGMASATLILLWIGHVSSIDQFHTKLGRLYQVFSNDKVEGAIRTLNATPEIMAPELAKDFPEIEGASRINWGSRNLLSPVLSAEASAKADSTNQGILSNGNVVDPDFLKMFTLPFVTGDPNTALNDPMAMVITQSLARRLFHTEDAYGRTVRMGARSLFKITGILKDAPPNTMFRDSRLSNSSVSRMGRATLAIAVSPVGRTRPRGGSMKR